MNRSLLGIIGIVLSISLLTACSLPAYKLLAAADQPYQVHNTASFKHLTVLNSASAGSGAAVVFIDGDGEPWQSRHRIAHEPSSDRPLLLRWFLSFELPALYLGRPCYYALDDPSCSAYWYTHGRYSEAVVNSMVQAVKELLPGRALVLVGHSGGGTLAMLMAERLSQVQAVVTLAGNLLVQRWVEHHGYSPLLGSLDPATRPGLREAIQQIHFYAPDDEVIKAEWIALFAAKQKNVQLRALPVSGHSEGWMQFSGEVMVALQVLLATIEQQQL